MMPNKLKFDGSLWVNDKEIVKADEDYELFAEIVRRYNAFDGLLAACKKALNFVEDEDSLAGNRDIFAALNAAIAAAEAKE